MNPEVDACIARSEQWSEVMGALQVILLDCELTEELKWRQPCYTNDNKNIVILQQMKEFLALMFFKGALVADPAGVLESQGPNSRSARRICLTSVGDVERLADTVRAYIGEAIAVEAAGRKVEPAGQLELLGELKDCIDSDSGFKAAFESLTPGRQREYNLYFSGAKQASTRVSRIEKYTPKILSGKGFRDR